MHTAECVTPRHPDKLCDRIADALVDIALAADPLARCAIEVQGGHGTISITGESSHLFTDDILRETAYRITDQHYHLSSTLALQSPEIARGVDTGGAGDQGIMVGFATRDTPAFLPREYFLARSLCQYLYAHYPVDGKTQVTISGDAVLTILASFQDATTVDLLAHMRAWMSTHGIADAELLANPCGDWTIGGFDADAGCTGRKIVVDAYGPRVPVGGGAFSGKDATKVDRSAAYAARHAALTLLAKNPSVHAARVVLAYAIGKALPIQAEAVFFDATEHPTHTQSLSPADFTPDAIITRFSLRSPHYESTASFGHFGHSTFPWERVTAA